MAAPLGFKTFTVGEVLSAADVNGYLMQGVLVFATTAARDAAITSPQEGQFAFTKDTNSLFYYDGAAWVASGATGDIEGVTAGTGISGGGTSGTVTVTNSMATAIDAKGDLIVGTGADTFSRLAVGTNTYTLVADSSEATGLKWAAPAGGGGMTLLQTVTLSGTSTTTSSFSTAYKNLVLQFYGVTTTINGAINIRVNSNTGNNYGDAYLSDSNNTFTINAGVSSFRMLDYNVSGTNYSSGKIEFPEYANTSATTKAAIVHQANTAARNTFNIAYITETTAISTLTFLTGSSPTMGGTVLIYGVN